MPKLEILEYLTLQLIFSSLDNDDIHLKSQSQEILFRKSRDAEDNLHGQGDACKSSLVSSALQVFP
jgi:hypothetical protein